jgi:hypothetical protein
MWFPGKKITEELRDLFITALNDEEVKKELSKRFEENIEEEKNKNHTSHTARTDSGRANKSNHDIPTRMSYDELTSGNVNLQHRMAASGYDVYGRTILASHKDMSHNSTYKKMKNKIQYKNGPQDGYRNRGDRSQV